VGIESRPAADYARRGGYYGVTVRNYADQDEAFGFSQVDYTAIQHIPILRDAWVLSLRGEVTTTAAKDDQVIPFYMLPSLGGGSSLRGFASWRFRDRHSLLLSADWRVLANHFMDVVAFYDAGKAVANTSEIDLEGLKKNYGLGFRLHGPISTPLRIDFAKSNEGLQMVFAAKAAF
jgi:outer membrane protein assembly factor BamA